MQNSKTAIPTRDVENLFKRVRKDREVTVAISNALQNVIATAPKSSAVVNKIMKDMQALINQGVAAIIKALDLVESDLSEITRFETLLDTPIQDLLDARDQISGVLSFSSIEHHNDAEEAVGTLMAVLDLQCELKTHLLASLDENLRNSICSVIKLESVIDDLQAAFARLSARAVKR